MKFSSATLPTLIARVLFPKEARFVINSRFFTLQWLWQRTWTALLTVVSNDLASRFNFFQRHRQRRRQCDALKGLKWSESMMWWRNNLYVERMRKQSRIFKESATRMLGASTKHKLNSNSRWIITKQLVSKHSLLDFKPAFRIYPLATTERFTSSLLFHFKF